MTYPADKQSYIQIGWLGEADARRIVLDISELKALCPDATWKLLYKRPEDELPYAAETTVEGNELTWHISSVDVAQIGRGSAQVLGVKSDSRTGADQVVVKGPVHTVRIEQSLIGETENPVHVWLELAQEAAQRAEGAALDARLSADSAEQNATQAAKSAENANTDAATATSAAQNATHAAETAKSAAESADTAAEKAESSATTAQKSADAAAQSATTAQESASAAAQSATQAQESANAAAQSATQSQNSAATAETLAQQASNSAQLAAHSADDAADSAVVAQEHAQNAGDSATKVEQSETRAQLSATAAQQYASQAQGSASAAAQSAAGAHGDAGNALQSANSASTAASNASASANAASNSAQQAASAADTARTDAATAQDAAQDAVEHASAAQKAAEAAENAAQEALGIIDDGVIALDSTWSSDNIVATLCPPFEVYGNIVQCEPVEGSPLDVTVEITPVQEGAGDPSPENVRPIVGWDTVNVWRGGKNLLDAKAVKLETRNGIAVTYDENTNIFTINGTATAPMAICNTNIVSIPTYNIPMTISVTKVNGDIVVPDGGNAVAYLGKGDSPTEKINAFFADLAGGARTATIDKRYITYFWFYFTASVACENLQVQIQLEPGSTATAYEPYRGETVAVELGQTVYGGRYSSDGNLVLTYKHFSLPISAMNNSENFPGWSNVDGLEECIVSNQDEIVSSAIINCAKDIWANTKNARKTIYRTSTSWGMTQSDLKATYPDLVCEIVMPLLTPVTVPLDALNILALSGLNVIYADAGLVTIKGYSDPVTIVNRLSSRIAALEDAQTTI